MNILTVYPNCSLGGMATVYINRALFTPDIAYDFVFFKDAGGKSRFEEIPNIELRIIDEKNAENFFNYVSAYKNYDIVRVCSWPGGLKKIRETFPHSRLEYEIHSARRRFLLAELARVNAVDVDKIICPSEWLREEIIHNLPIDIKARVGAYPNLLTDYGSMTGSGHQFQFEGHKGQIPLLWIGRAHFSVPKNYHDFFQILSLLPQKFFAVMVLSLETDPQNIAQTIGIATQYGILDRLVLLMNIDTFEMANLYSSIKARKGIYCSTALSETFGYAVHESLSFKIPVVSYRIGPFENIANRDLHLIELGDVFAFRDKILELA